MRIKSFSAGLWILGFSFCSGCSHQEIVPEVSIASPPVIRATEKAQERKDSPSESVACLAGKDERKLELLARAPGCALRYTKLGKSADIATAKFGNGHCKNALEKVKGHLESAGFHCGS